MLLKRSIESVDQSACSPAGRYMNSIDRQPEESRKSTVGPLQTSVLYRDEGSLRADDGTVLSLFHTSW